MLKAAVLLLVLSLVARRVLPRRRLPWTVPLAVVVVLVAVRTIGFLTGEQ